MTDCEKTIHKLFGAQNLLLDDTLQAKLEENEWVEIEWLLQTYPAKLSSYTAEQIAAACTNSPLLTASDDLQSIKRIVAYEPQSTERLMSIVYYEGLWKPWNTKEAILKKFGGIEVDFITENFLGWCLVEYTDKEEAQVAMEKARELKLHAMTKLEWNKLRREYELRRQQQYEIVNEHKIDFEKGLVWNVEIIDKTNKTKIKEDFSKYGEVAIVEYKRGAGWAVVEFAEVDISREIENGRVLTGQEEVQYWTKKTQF